MKMKKRKLNLPRVPLPRQTEKVVPAERGGRHNRNREKEKIRREIQAERE
jgi:hypothetical protein